MAEEKKEAWLNYLALSSVIIAVCATLSTFRGGSYSTRTMLSQTQASDQWAFYQAKSLKSNMYEIQMQELERQLTLLPAKAPAGLKHSYEVRIEDYKKRISRYDEERSQIEKEARKLETIRDEAMKHGQWFGIGVIFFQVAILLSSIAAIMKKKIVWYLGMIVSMGGLIFF
ncbi:MAG TPA: DUF4337 domain-containing protein, partial [Bacteroidota bacterium]|nr:DUF4337 domain-containing protein [Bacteroidota bacterium]